MDLRHAIDHAKQHGATHFAEGEGGTLSAYRPARSVSRCDESDKWSRLDFVLVDGEYHSTWRWVFSVLDPAATKILT